MNVMTHVSERLHRFCTIVQTSPDYKSATIKIFLPFSRQRFLTTTFIFGPKMELFHSPDRTAVRYAIISSVIKYSLCQVGDQSEREKDRRRSLVRTRSGNWLLMGA